MAVSNAQNILKRLILERLLNKFELALLQTPLNLDFLEFVCRQELYLLQALSRHVDILTEIVEALKEVFRLIRITYSDAPETAVVLITGLPGRPRLDIERQHLVEMLQTNLSVPCIAKLLGVSARTVFRRTRDFGLSVSELYTTINDEELDNLVLSIKNEMPTAGYRMVMGRMLSLGFRVQWKRMAASMHRVDAIGILSRLANVGCVVRRTYSVRGPLSLVHVDTNHKLIRYNIVIFGGIDGYSRKVMYLNAATNNRSSTAFHFFLEATQNHGIPSRVRADQGVENVQIARFMFSVRGTDRGSFISGKSVNNQRIEPLWRDVRVLVTSKYYSLLHSLEDNGLLDISSTEDLFCVHYTVLPRLQTDMGTFVVGWNHHPLSTEGNRSPEQMWQIGLMHTNVDQPESPEVLIKSFNCTLSTFFDSQNDQNYS
ncbi:uncharacterized protein LOC117823781 [Notolabrus celidotus]|uniref:uncharacterized protein LOC117823781 n=1 Tax=Notolabrus celidotus TaxID=1203425 RepID=UPI00148FEB63|nr:uncharacterized protein LOC117823781 [Notolabrus celidotus]XP_034554903.1 uncharacterized protein LOC117823781 [Notolabrus celidotus]XP_034554904.1 uncharacterized protein LOC117823781 [Notolabrus celidotus]